MYVENKCWYLIVNLSLDVIHQLIMAECKWEGLFTSQCPIITLYLLEKPV